MSDCSSLALVMAGDGVVIRPLGIDEEEEDSPVVRPDITLTSRGVNSCSSEMHTPVFVYYQVLLSVLAQHGQVGLCFYDSKDSSLHYMIDTPDNYELRLLPRGKHHLRQSDLPIKQK